MDGETARLQRALEREDGGEWGGWVASKRAHLSGGPLVRHGRDPLGTNADGAVSATWRAYWGRPP